MSAPDLLALRDDPPRLGRLAAQARSAAFEADVLVREVPAPAPRPEVAALYRDGDWSRCDTWPAPSTWKAGDRIVCNVAPERANAWVEYLQSAGEVPAGCSLAPYSTEPAGTHKLWLVASARLALPPSVRVEARHDLLGIRVAQVALGFGADTLSGPIEPDRKLPLAGTTRPNENTRAGLFALVEQTGLSAVEVKASAP
jgi:hypothetical protein